MQEIRVIDVNRETLRMFGAADTPDLLRNINKVFRGEMQDSFAEQLRDLWDNKTSQQREVVNYSLSGDLINIHIQFTVLQHLQHLQPWDLVLVSLVDITARKKAARAHPVAARPQQTVPRRAERARHQPRDRRRDLRFGGPAGSSIAARRPRHDEDNSRFYAGANAWDTARSAAAAPAAGGAWHASCEAMACSLS